MIKFKSLINVIHQSIHSAAQEVEAEGTKHIETFFDKIDHPVVEQQGDEDDALDALKRGDSAQAEAILTASGDSRKRASATELEATFRPKMVAMAFPSRTENGIESVIANVPLITLSPISTPRIKEIKFAADLNITTDEDNEIRVAFINPNKINQGQTFSHTSTNTRLEITLTGEEPPEGLRQVIEGYEKALRSQIPG